MFRGVLQAHTGEQANSYPRKGPVRLTDANRGVGLRARGFRPSYPTQASKQESEREREREGREKTNSPSGVGEKSMLLASESPTGLTVETG